ncbi:MAG: phosphoribosylformylglycinamidine synthase subunit PurS [Rhodospirillales bacterium]|nr:phosphoribosylformylglycinamidine synthase subunit PurS [Rhodospirillales bacterium]
MKAKVHVTYKDGVLDPQGKAVQHSLAAMGFVGVEQVRQGKYIEIDLADADAEAAKATLDAMCRQLLANTVIENYTIDVGE